MIKLIPLLFLVFVACDGIIQGEVEVCHDVITDCEPWIVHIDEGSDMCHYQERIGSRTPSGYVSVWAESMNGQVVGPNWYYVHPNKITHLRIIDGPIMIEIP